MAMSMTPYFMAVGNEVIEVTSGEGLANRVVFSHQRHRYEVGASQAMRFEDLPP